MEHLHLDPELTFAKAIQNETMKKQQAALHGSESMATHSLNLDTIRGKALSVTTVQYKRQNTPERKRDRKGKQKSMQKDCGRFGMRMSESICF